MPYKQANCESSCTRKRIWTFQICWKLLPFQTVIQSINCCHWAHPWMGKARGNAKQCQPWRVTVFKEALLSLPMRFVQMNPYGLLWAGYCFTRCRVQRGSDGIFPVRKHVIKVEAWRLKAKFYLLTPSSNLNLSGSLWESSKMLSFSPGGNKMHIYILVF